MQSTSITNQAHVTLKYIQQAINKGDSIIPVDANFYFTKGNPGRTSGYILRDKSLEQDCKHWINSRISFELLLKRYKQYDPDLTPLEWPRHYATRFVNICGNATYGENIFMFFPEVLGLNSNHINDYFGFEFIDTWTSVFDEIVFPCMRKVFDNESQLILFTSLRPVLDKTIYLASVFHEIGHRCGYWRVSPTKDVRIKINKFNTDVLGELATDTLLVNFLIEFPEVLYFVFLQRLFWFGRFGFKDNPMNGKLNTDNDTWIGSYLWNKYIKAGALSQMHDNRWHIHFEKLISVFKEIRDDTDMLGETIIRANCDHDQLVHRWMKKNVTSKKRLYYLPKSLHNVFMKCIDISEKPINKF